METEENTESVWNSLLVTFTSVLIAVFFVLLFVAFGWYIVWKCFLSRFKFVRELLGDSQKTVIEQPTKRTRKRQE